MRKIVWELLTFPEGMIFVVHQTITNYFAEHGSRLLNTIRANNYLFSVSFPIPTEFSLSTANKA